MKNMKIAKDFMSVSNILLKKANTKEKNLKKY